MRSFDWTCLSTSPAGPVDCHEWSRFEHSTGLSLQVVLSPRVHTMHSRVSTAARVARGTLVITSLCLYCINFFLRYARKQLNMFHVLLYTYFLFIRYLINKAGKWVRPGNGVHCLGHDLKALFRPNIRLTRPFNGHLDWTKSLWLLPLLEISCRRSRRTFVITYGMSWLVLLLHFNFQVLRHILGRTRQ